MSYFCHFHFIQLSRSERILLNSLFITEWQAASWQHAEMSWIHFYQVSFLKLFLLLELRGKKTNCDCLARPGVASCYIKSAWRYGPTRVTHSTACEKTRSLLTTNWVLTYTILLHSQLCSQMCNIHLQETLNCTAAPHCTYTNIRMIFLLLA